MENKNIICPITFVGDEPQKNQELNFLYTYPYLNHLTNYMNNKDESHRTYFEYIIRDFIKNNLDNLIKTSLLNYFSSFDYEFAHTELLDIIHNELQNELRYNFTFLHLYSDKFDENVIKSEIYQFSDIFISNMVSIFNHIIDYYIDYKFKENPMDLYSMIYESTYGSKPEEAKRLDIMYTFCSSTLREVAFPYIVSLKNAVVLLDETIFNMIKYIYFNLLSLKDLKLLKESMESMKGENE